MMYRGRMLGVGQDGWVMCSTNQTQRDGAGHQHWQVHKIQGDDTTHTRIQGLDETARVEELARMLGGVEITESTRNHAKEMLSKAQAA